MCAGVGTYTGSTFEGLLKQGVQTDPRTRMRWRVLLPVAMLALSASLMVLAEKQQPMLRGMGTGWETPARVINSLINGPGFYVGGLIRLPIPYPYGWLNYDGDRILGIALFWFCLLYTSDAADE